MSFAFDDDALASGEYHRKMADLLADQHRSLSRQLGLLRNHLHWSERAETEGATLVKQFDQDMQDSTTRIAQLFTAPGVHDAGVDEHEAA